MTESISHHKNTLITSDGSNHQPLVIRGVWCPEIRRFRTNMDCLCVASILAESYIHNYSHRVGHRIVFECLSGWSVNSSSRYNPIIVAKLFTATQIRNFISRTLFGMAVWHFCDGSSDTLLREFAHYMKFYSYCVQNRFAASCSQPS